MKISKVRRTNYGGPGAAPPVGRGNSQPRAVAWDGVYDARAVKDAAEHDRAVDGHSVETLCAMAKDLGARGAYDRRDHEHRWIMGRRAAVLRMLSGMRRDAR